MTAIYSLPIVTPEKVAARLKTRIHRQSIQKPNFRVYMSPPTVAKKIQTLR